MENVVIIQVADDFVEARGVERAQAYLAALELFEIALFDSVVHLLDKFGIRLYARHAHEARQLGDEDLPFHAVDKIFCHVYSPAANVPLSELL